MTYSHPVNNRREQQSRIMSRMNMQLLSAFFAESKGSLSARPLRQDVLEKKRESMDEGARQVHVAGVLDRLGHASWKTPCFPTILSAKERHRDARDHSAEQV